MTQLSVNINKVATLRNARGGNTPDVVQFARDCEAFGAQGITVHPRPDERHIRRSDVYALKQVVTTELNIEGYPSEDFMRLVMDVVPTQVTLVPDMPGQLTSNHGWDTLTYATEPIRGEQYTLTEVVNRLHTKGIRVSVFVDTDAEMVRGAKAIGADRVELYTGPYAEWHAERFGDSQKGQMHLADAQVPEEMMAAAMAAKEAGLGLNAGHDLSLTNLKNMITCIPWVDEVSIGHALISDALYLGINQTIKQYKLCCSK